MIIALAGILPTSVPAQVRNPVSATVPFELYKGHIFVSAYVNGKGPYRFGFDTGASGDGRADLRLTQVLSLPTVGQSETSDGIKTATAQLVSVKSLRLGPVEKHDIQILSRDYNGRSGNEHTIMGIIARDFVAGWLVTIDYPRRTIRRGRVRTRLLDPGLLQLRVLSGQGGHGIEPEHRGPEGPCGQAVRNSAVRNRAGKADEQQCQTVWNVTQGAGAHCRAEGRRTGGPLRRSVGHDDQHRLRLSQGLHTHGGSAAAVAQHQTALEQQFGRFDRQSS
jgi:hypothetical protein